jgi:hypothetical protein
MHIQGLTGETSYSSLSFSFFFSFSYTTSPLHRYLCAVNFDDERGITYFSANPNFLLVKQFLGVLFAALFIAYRVVVWPCVSYHFMLDSWFLLKNNIAHSPGIVTYFMGVNGFLTAVQIFWLGEIMGHAVKLFQPLSKQQQQQQQQATLAVHQMEDIGTSSPPGRRRSSRITKSRY